MAENPLLVDHGPRILSLLRLILKPGPGGERAKDKADTASASLSAPPAAVEVLDVSDYRPRKIPSPTWRECIKEEAGTLLSN